MPRLDRSRLRALWALVLALGVAGCGAPHRELTDAAQLTEASSLPCATDDVLVRVCQQCHSSPMKNGAPFPLVTYANTQVIIDGEPLSTHMGRALESGKMPLPPVEISDADKAVLLAWIANGAPPRDASEVCPLP